MSLVGSIWKPNLLMPSSSCRVHTVCRTFTRRCKQSLSDDPSLLSILKKRTKSFLRKQDFVTHIAKNKKVIFACKKMRTAVNKFKQQLARHKRNLIMCVAMAFTFDWYKERICVDELIRYLVLSLGLIYFLYIVCFVLKTAPRIWNCKRIGKKILLK